MNNIHPIFAETLDRFVSGGSRGNQSFVAEAVRGRREDANQLVDAGVRFIRQGIEGRLDRAFLQDFAKGLHDQIGDLVGLMQRDLDNAHLPLEGAAVDLAELDQIITKLEMRP